MTLRRLATGVALAALAQATMAQGNTVQTDHVRAEALVHAPDGVAPGRTVWVGLQLTHQPGWHTYWRNPGDSGLPTTVKWQLPSGVTAGEVAWPAPKKIPYGPLANYGYEGTVVLPVPLTLSPSSSDFASLKVKFKASWLVCKDECIPEEGEFAVQVPAGSAFTRHAAAFKGAFDAAPKALSAGTRARVDGAVLRLVVAGLPASIAGKQLEFFSEVADVVETAGAWTQAWEGERWTAAIPISTQRSASPAVLPVVVTSGGMAWRADASVVGSWPSGTSAAVASDVPAAASIAAGDSISVSLAAALLGGLLGGLILNLMPCVFPVLAIKVVGFTQRGNDRRARHLGAYAYAAGVVLSFLALGGLLLVLRAAGEQLGWGFQLQSPLVVAGLAALFTALGLNLAGVFEFGQFLPSSVATLQAKHPVVDSFLSGVLAVAVASPCTAPFMGASLGLAVSLPPVQAMSVFAALGVGMALPYVAAALVPGIAERVRRPGAWMDVFKKFMAFPMFATATWLVWVLGQQTGVDGAGALLALLVGFSMVLWSVTLKGRVRTAVAALSVAALSGLAVLVGPSVVAVTPASNRAVDATWQPWAPGKAEALVAQGRPVFVDFTAAWCVTCQYNKRTTLADQVVLSAFQAKNVVLLRADWTKRDPAITAALSALGRNGVPVYVLHRGGRPPVVLSEVISVDEVRAALSTL
jgi:thiol:disulfide interchange protein